MDSVTQWIERLKGSAQQNTAELLWERYVERLMRVARRKLGGGPRAIADEEDVAIVAFTDLLAGIKDNRFSQLNDRDDLWQILLMLTERKAISQNRALNTQKRGGQAQHADLSHDLEAPEPTPEAAHLLAEELDELLNKLGSPSERDIAIKRMQGYKVDEIVAELGIPKATVERRLRLIRKTWSNEMNPEPE